MTDESHQEQIRKLEKRIAHLETLLHGLMDSPWGFKVAAERWLRYAEEMPAVVEQRVAKAAKEMLRRG